MKFKFSLQSVENYREFQKNKMDLDLQTMFTEKQNLEKKLLEAKEKYMQSVESRNQNLTLGSWGNWKTHEDGLDVEKQSMINILEEIVLKNKEIKEQEFLIQKKNQEIKTLEKLKNKREKEHNIRIDQEESKALIMNSKKEVA